MASGISAQHMNTCSYDVIMLRARDICPLRMELAMSDHRHQPDSHGPGHHDHDHHHGHDHGRGHGAHSHAPASFGRAFAIGIALNVAYVAAEALYGVMAHSLALLADAG